MLAFVSPTSARRRGAPTPLFVCAAITGLSDIAFANAIAMSRSGTFMPGRVFQSVATGAMGPAAFERGWASIVLGVGAHFLIALLWTLAFAVVQRRVAWVRRLTRPLGSALAIAAIYGMLVWLVMDFLVIPVSRARVTPPSAPVFWVMLVGHAIFVGIPLVLGVRAIAGRDDR